MVETETVETETVGTETAERDPAERSVGCNANGEKRGGEARDQLSPDLDCHSYPRRLADTPKPHDEHSFFLVWYDFSPQRRHFVWVVLFFFPWLGVPAPVME
jgi:hypothetical protein